MRTLKNIIGTLILSVAFFGCSNQNAPATNNEEVLHDGTINGTISNYTAGAFDAIECIQLESSGTSLGRCTPSADGKFSIKLSTPTTLHNTYFSETGITVSDPTANYNQSVLAIYKNNNPIGFILNCNFTTVNSISSIYDLESNLLAGNAYSVLMYADKNCTIKGSISSVNYDLTFKKGWNEVVGKKVTSSSTSATTTIPSDLKWRYFLVSGN